MPAKDALLRSEGAVIVPFSDEYLGKDDATTLLDKSSAGSSEVRGSKKCHSDSELQGGDVGKVEASVAVRGGDYWERLRFA